MRSLEMPLLEDLCPGGSGGRISRTSFLDIAKRHCFDWMLIVALSGAFYSLHVLHPFRRFVGKYMLDNLRYPMKADTIPFLYIPMLSVGAPVIAIVCFYMYHKNVRDLHNAFLGLGFSLALAGVVTNGIKISVGRPRPDFFWRCFPDGNEFYTAIGEVSCTGDEAVIREGHKSFPSGHASWCFAGLGYLSIYLAGKLKLFDRKGHVWKIFIPFVPLAIAAYAAISRVDDYKHHWEDVSFSAVTGLAIATLSYRQHFPSLADITCHKTFSELASQPTPSIGKETQSSSSREEASNV